MNQLLGVTYEDGSVIQLDVQQSRVWRSILIVSLVVVTCILLLILCAKCCQRKPTKQAKTNAIPQDVLPQRDSVASLSYASEQRIVEELSRQAPSEDVPRWRSSVSHTSARFILGYPCLDPAVQPFTSADSSLLNHQ